MVMTEELEKGVSEMCNLSEGILREEQLRIVSELIRNTDWTLEKAMQVLGLTDIEKQEIYVMMAVSQ